ncbi:MAG TPA: Eco29kI family restriction endonuclease [Candidatus Binatia bacterium]|nr:Eco29kI family restriction endonuclease [Candidatus Binatia bacterium]
MSKSKPFNPLDRVSLGASVAQALLQQEPASLGKIKPFSGAGIYAVYYTGNFKPYELIAKRCRNGKFEIPIYVGKAIPAGARKGGTGLASSAGKVLYNRLMEHAESIRVAGNLDIKDFSCRFLVVDDIWIPLGESLLIAKFSPIWNNIVDGFGNHDPGKGRYQGMRPRWDVLHPGRAWAAKCKARLETPDQIIADVKTYLRTTIIPEAPTILFAGEDQSNYDTKSLEE